MQKKKKKKPASFAWAALLSRTLLQVEGNRDINKYSEERSRDESSTQLCRRAKSHRDPRSPEHSLTARP